MQTYIRTKLTSCTYKVFPQIAKKNIAKQHGKRKAKKETKKKGPRSPDYFFLTFSLQNFQTK